MVRALTSMGAGMTLGLIAGLSLVSLLAGAHGHQPGHPAKPRRLVVPAAGGVTDQVARVISIRLREQLGQRLDK